MDFQRLLEDAGLTPRSYSGRGMYGKECLGVNTDMSAMAVAGWLIKALKETVDDESQWDELADILYDTVIDSMGRGIIMYWPSIAFEGEENEDLSEGKT